jgi:hypothetical protein
MATDPDFSEVAASVSEKPRYTSPPLVLTSAVRPSAPFVELSAPVRRVGLSLAAIGEWLNIDETLRIVICDGTGYDFSRDVKMNFPSSEIECLSFLNNRDSVARQGKGFGEGEIMNHALKHSQIVKSAECFAKCTAKLWVENYLECLDGFNGCFGCEKRYRHFSLTWADRVDTRFYLADKCFYRKVLSDCHRHVDDRAGYYLEHAFWNALKNNGLCDVWLRSRPIVCGVSGSTGKHYAGGGDSAGMRWAFYLLRSIRYWIDHRRIT